MATFPSITPSFGFTKNSKPNVRVIKFGDGFEQRLTYGINQNPKQYDLTWENITVENANIIKSFLNSRAFDNESFDFTPPQQSISTSGRSSLFGFRNRATGIPHCTGSTSVMPSR